MPQRFLRPGITTSQRFNCCSWQAQSLFTRLLTLVDDFGRYDAEPRLLRSHAFPFGDPFGKEIPMTTLANICEQLSASGLVLFFVAPDSKKYLQVVRWQERARADKSKYPAFDNTCEQMFADVSKCSPPSSSPSPSPSPLHPRHSTNGSGEPSRAAGTSEELIRELSESPAYQGIDVRREFYRMVEWCKNRPGQKPTRRRFVNWLNRVDKPLPLAAKRQQLDPSKIEVPSDFKTWASEKYPKRAEDIAKYRTWDQVPDSLRGEWKREKVAPLMAGIGGQK